MAVVVVASGTNRVCEKKVAAIVGEKLGHADADFVCEATGYGLHLVVSAISDTVTPEKAGTAVQRSLAGSSSTMAGTAAGTPFSVQLTPIESRLHDPNRSN